MPADAEAASALVRRALEEFEVPLTRFAMSLLHDLGRSRDAVQDTLLKLYQQDPAAVEARLKSWLFTVCRNRCLDILKKNKRMIVVDSEKLPAVESRTPDPYQAILKVEDRQKVDEDLHEMRHQIETLSPNQREVLRLKFQANMSYKEIGKILGLSTGNVGFILHTSLKKLRQLMNREGEAASAPAKSVVSDR